MKINRLSAQSIILQFLDCSDEVWLLSIPTRRIMGPSFVCLFVFVCFFNISKGLRMSSGQKKTDSWIQSLGSRPCTACTVLCIHFIMTVEEYSNVSELKSMGLFSCSVQPAKISWTYMKLLWWVWMNNFSCCMRDTSIGSEWVTNWNKPWTINHTDTNVGRVWAYRQLGCFSLNQQDWDKTNVQDECTCTGMEEGDKDYKSMLQICEAFLNFWLAFHFCTFYSGLCYEMSAQFTLHASAIINVTQGSESCFYWSDLYASSKIKSVLEHSYCITAFQLQNILHSYFYIILDWMLLQWRVYVNYLSLPCLKIYSTNCIQMLLSLWRPVNKIEDLDS